MGEFVKKVLQRRLGRFPDVADVMAEVDLPRFHGRLVLGVDGV